MVPSLVAPASPVGGSVTTWQYVILLLVAGAYLFVTTGVALIMLLFTTTAVRLMAELEPAFSGEPEEEVGLSQWPPWDEDSDDE